MPPSAASHNRAAPGIAGLVRRRNLHPMAKRLPLLGRDHGLGDAVLAWRLSNTLGAEFCVEVYKFGHPEFWTGYRRRFFSEANRIGFIAGVDDQPGGVISAGSLDG